MAIKQQQITQYYDDKSYIRITHSSSNCKLSYIDSVGGARKESINEVLKECRQTVHLTVTNKAQKKFIEDNYEVYYSEEVPVGYYNTDVYHILIRNRLTSFPLDNIRDKIIENKNIINKLSLKEIESRFSKIFKSKLKKADKLNELIKQLK